MSCFYLPLIFFYSSRDPPEQRIEIFSYFFFFSSFLVGEFLFDYYEKKSSLLSLPRENDKCDYKNTFCYERRKTIKSGVKIEFDTFIGTFKP